MRKFSIILFLFAILTLITVTSAKAEITIKDYMSQEFLSKQGYSPAALEIVEVTKAKTFGESLPPYQYRNIFSKLYDQGMIYLDPARDDHEFGRHEIKMYPSPTGY